MKKSRHISTSRFIFFGFLGVIVLGTFILTLPISSSSGEFTSVVDALFTATSATCVTGLVVHDTATYWSAFGQGVIIVLIQIGGMGVITIALLLTRMSGRKIGLRQRTLMQEAISAHKMGGIVRLTGFIVKMMLIFELAGAVLMYPEFAKQFGIIKGIWYSLFHSISAFCNAGFDLMGVREHYSSLTTFSSSVLINVVIMLLIIIGGIGFVTWDDIKKHKLHFGRYRMQSKVILGVTSILIIVPVLYFYFFEFGKATWNFDSEKDRVLASLFQTVSPRTAGFNTVDLNQLSGVGQLITIILMLIGAAPGSTAGGMKVTTVAVLFSTAVAVFRKRQDANLFKRRLSNEVARSASATLLMYTFLFMFGGIVISIADNIPIMKSLFETASAVGTVGLSLGITPSLSMVSKIVLIVLMFLGRVGGLTVIFATLSNKNHNVSRLPEEKIMVG